MGSTIGFESVEAKLLLVCLWTVRLFFSVNTMGKNTVWTWTIFMVSVTAVAWIRLSPESHFLLSQDYFQPWLFSLLLGIFAPQVKIHLKLFIYPFFTNLRCTWGNLNQLQSQTKWNSCSLESGASFFSFVSSI